MSKTVKLVIEIPKEQYEYLAKIADIGEEPLGYFERVIMCGTPLDDVLQALDKSYAPTIIEADKESTEPHECNTCKFGSYYKNGYDVTTMDDECGGCCDTTCIFYGTNDTHPICKDYKPMASKALEQESVLDKIISEINEYKSPHADFTHISIKRVVAIINKYKSESEG